jgi:dihydrofolate synthase/folylpolyglutamate synthase
LTETQRTETQRTEAQRRGDPLQPEDVRYQDALGFLYDRINYERMASGTSRYRFRLKRITELLRRMSLEGYLHADSPEPKVPLVHISGTKGKGSTAAMVAAALSAAGLRTGLYTSPHLHRLEERFCVDGQPCSSQQLISLVQRVKPVTELVERAIGSLSFFELTTAIALMHFDATKCDAIVMEVGLGGRLDSTNVCSPSVSAITSIGLDHQHVLGDTLVEIAAEKAGIFKAGVPVVSGVADPGAAEVVTARAAASGSALFQLGRDFNFDCDPLPQWGSNVQYHGQRPPLSKHESTTLLMEGKHQARNAALSIAIIDLLRDQGIKIPSAAIAAGLGQLQCAGRIECIALPENVLGIVDAAHNHDSITALCDCLCDRLPDRRIAVVFGTSVDKSAEPMLDLLADNTDELFLTRFLGNPRFRPPAELKPLVPAPLAKKTRVMEDPIEACEAGLASVTPGGALVICGSFFLAAECRGWLAAKSS